MTAEVAFDEDRLTCTATKEETDPWWTVDLGRNHNVGVILFYVDDVLPHSPQYDVFVGMSILA